jgi:TolB protein
MRNIAIMLAALGLLLGAGLWFAPAPLRAQDAAPPAPTPLTATVDTGGVRLRVRSGPGVAYPIVARLNDGDQTIVVARNEAGDWLLVTAPGAPTGQGWAAAAYLRLAGSLAQTPVMVDSPPSAPASAPLPAPPPAPTGLYGKLAVPVFDASRRTYDVWTVNADGSGLRQVVTEASAPALSQDGSLLAYRRWQVDDRGIVVARADGSAPLRVTDKLEDTLPSFSPDGAKVAFSSTRESDRRSRLYYAWSDEQNRRAWEWGPGGLFGEHPDWLLDGRIFSRIYRLGETLEELWSVSSLTGLEQQRLFATASLHAPDATADGRTVVYMGADRQGNWDIYRLEVASGAVTRLTNHAGADGLPVWSPNAEYIAFVSDRGGRWGLWVMNADGSNERLIVNLPGAVDGRVRYEPAHLNNGWLEERIAWSP